MELSRDDKGAIAAFAGPDGLALERALGDLIDSQTAAALAVTKGDYPELFHGAIAERVVRRPEKDDARVRIFGPLEARLQNVDRVVLGGLNEGTWPPEPRNDPWLSRPMRADLGLDLPERRIGLAAHDFAQALGAKEVILVARCQGRRRADRHLALRAAARGGGRRGALEGGARARRAISRLGARARRPPARHARAASRADAAAGSAARRSFRSPTSRTGCAIPTRSMPSMCCA